VRKGDGNKLKKAIKKATKKKEEKKREDLRQILILKLSVSSANYTHLRVKSEQREWRGKWRNWRVQKKDTQ
jgi:hypothetical protein